MTMTFRCPFTKDYYAASTYICVYICVCMCPRGHACMWVSLVCALQQVHCRIAAIRGVISAFRVLRLCLQFHASYIWISCVASIFNQSNVLTSPHYKYVIVCDYFSCYAALRFRDVLSIFTRKQTEHVISIRSDCCRHNGKWVWGIFFVVENDYGDFDSCKMGIGV